MNFSVCEKFKDFPHRRGNAIGGLGLNNEPMICGGIEYSEEQKNCYSYINDTWVVTSEMNQPRSSFASSKYPGDGHIFVTGELLAFILPMLD